MIEVTKNDFEGKVLNSDKKVLVDFWAPWCNPCKMMLPVLEELDKELGDEIKIAKINIDNDPELASNFGVMSIPTFMLFEKGKLIKSAIGMQSLDRLKEMLEL